jgi:antimicrobial peptide system SdpA family protein
MDTPVLTNGPVAEVPPRLAAVRLVVLAAALGSLTLVAAGYMFHAALPFNPVEIPGGRSLDVRLIAPQGWKFFTRDPQEERLFVRTPDGSGGWSSDTTTMASAPRHLFGVRRTGRAQPMEMSKILSQVREEQWSACVDDPDACLARAPDPLALANPDSTPTLCGPVGFVLQRPIPWAWARRLGDVQLDSKVLRAQVSCSN